MELVRYLLVGLIIGLANIIPGVSGGTIAVSMGIYDKLISSLANIRKDWRASASLLLPVAAGAGIGVGLLSFVLTWLFGRYPFATNMAFIGLIIGGLPAVLDRLEAMPGRKRAPGPILAFSLFFLLVAGMAFLGEPEGYARLAADPLSLLLLAGAGMIAAAAMVIPGVSGSMVLMLLGYYHPILAYIRQFVEGVLEFDFPGAWQACIILFPFGAGVLAGIFLIAKLIEWIFQHWPMLAYSAIAGLIAASPVAVMVMSPSGRVGLPEAAAGTLLFLAGAYGLQKLG